MPAHTRGGRRLNCKLRRRAPPAHRRNSNRLTHTSITSNGEQQIFRADSNWRNRTRFKSMNATTYPKSGRYILELSYAHIGTCANSAATCGGQANTSYRRQGLTPRYQDARVCRFAASPVGLRRVFRLRRVGKLTNDDVTREPCPVRGIGQTRSSDICFLCSSRRSSRR